jgi:hypothetical protein
MNIITRGEWTARTPKRSPAKVAATRRAYFVVHHSGAPATQTVRAIQDWCMDGRGFNDVDYNFLVRATTGEIYEGRGWDVVGSHTTNYNTSGIGVCVIGNNEISAAAKRAVRWLYDQANKRSGKTLNIRGHRQLATTGTSCPGDIISAWLASGMPIPTEPAQTPRKTTKPQEAAMDVGAVWTEPSIPLTEMTADRLDLKEGDKRAAGLLLQNAVIASVDASAKLDKVIVQQRILEASIKLMAGKDFTDEPAIIAGVLAGFDPKAIAALVPREIAAQVADELTARLQS